MDEKLKKRLVGATVLVVLVVTFVPMLVEEKNMLATDPASMKPPPWPDQQKRTISPKEDSSQSKLPIPDLVEHKEAPAPVVTKSEAKPKPKPKPKPKQKTVAPVKQKPLSSWVVQAGSFSSKQNTDQLVKKLQKKGLPAYYEAVTIKGKKL